MSYPNYPNLNPGLPPQVQGQNQQPLNAQAQNFAMRSQGNLNIPNIPNVAGVTPAFGVGASALAPNAPQAIYGSPQFAQAQVTALHNSHSPQLQSSPIPLPTQISTPPRPPTQPPAQQQQRPQTLTPNAQTVNGVLLRLPAHIQQFIRERYTLPAEMWGAIQAWLKTEQGRAHAAILMRKNGSTHPTVQPQVQGSARQNASTNPAQQQQTMRPVSQLNSAHQQALQAVHQRVAATGSPQSPSSAGGGNPGFAPSVLATQANRQQPTTPVTQASRPAPGSFTSPNSSAIMQQRQLASRPTGPGSAPTFGGLVQTFRATSPVREREEDRVIRESNEVKRRREEGMRGTMRNEIARLMYGAGDVPDPAIDTVDMMEDLVVEFLADLCRPTPPIRSNPSAPHQSVPISSHIIRHRLSRPSMRKYLDRFDTMLYMSGELARSRRVLHPTQADLVEVVGKDYLGIDESGQTIGEVRRKGRPKRIREDEGGQPGGGDGEVKRNKIGRPRKDEQGGHSRNGSISQSARGSVGPGRDEKEKERKKPGPKKGWKKELNPGQLEEINRGRMKKGWRKKQNVSLGGGVKPEE